MLKVVGQIHLGGVELEIPDSGEATSLIPLADLAVWLDADQGTFSDEAMTTAQNTDAGEVRAWTDLSGNSRHVFRGSAGVSLKTAAKNGHRSLVFLNDTPLRFSSSLALSTLHFFVVCKNTTLNQNSVMGNSSSTNNFVLVDDNEVTFRTDVAPSATRVHAVGLNYLLASGWSDGASIQTRANATDGTSAANAGGTTFTGVGDFGSALPSGRFTGEVAEVIIYSNKQSDTKRDAILSYLNAKYALY